MEEISESTRQKGMELFKKRRIVKELESDRRIHFKVFGETDEHSVIFDKEKNEYSCDCPYSTLKQKECSHIVAAKLLKGNLRYMEH